MWQRLWASWSVEWPNICHPLAGLCAFTEESKPVWQAIKGEGTQWGCASEPVIGEPLFGRLGSRMKFKGYFPNTTHTIYTHVCAHKHLASISSYSWPKTKSQWWHSTAVPGISSRMRALNTNRPNGQITLSMAWGMRHLPPWNRTTLPETSITLRMLSFLELLILLPLPA